MLLDDLDRQCANGLTDTVVKAFEAHEEVLTVDAFDCISGQTFLLEITLILLQGDTIMATSRNHVTESTSELDPLLNAVGWLQLFLDFFTGEAVGVNISKRFGEESLNFSMLFGLLFISFEL